MGLINSNPGKYLPQSNGSFRVVQQSEALINDGLSWVVTHRAIAGDGSTVSLLVTAPSAGEIHMSVEVECNQAGSWTWSEAPNVTGGSAITSYNRNRQKVNGDPTPTKATDPDFVSAGTVLAQGVIGSTGGPVKLGGEGETARPWVLAHDTRYLARFLSTTADTTVIITAMYDLVSE